MSPTDFHGNYNRYKEHNNTQQILSYKALLLNIITTISCAFSPVMNKSLHILSVNICTSGGDPLFHTCYDGIGAKKTLPTQSKQKEVSKCQIQTMWWMW